MMPVHKGARIAGGCLGLNPAAGFGIIALVMKITPVQQKKKLVLPVAAAVVGSVVLSACQQQQQQLGGEPPFQLGGVIEIVPAKGAPQAKPAK